MLSAVQPFEQLASRVDPEATVRFYHVEKLLSSGDMGGRKFNGFHAGLGFQVNDEYFSLDFAPERPKDLTAMFVADMKPLYPSWMPELIGQAYAWLAATHDFEWTNSGRLEFNVRESTWNNQSATYIEQAPARRFRSFNSG